MKQIDRNMLREMLVPFLIGQGAIVLMLIGSVLYNNATIFLQNQVPVELVIRMVLFFIPFLIHMTMPVAVAVAASLAVSRLGRDSEITVKRAAGASLVRIFMPVFLLGAVASVGDFLWGEYVVPAARKSMESVIGDIPNHLPRLLPQPGQWIVSPDNSFAIYVSTMIPRRGYIELNGIQIDSAPKSIYNGESRPMHLAAAHGKYENGNWTLENAVGFSYTVDGKTVNMTSPQTQTIRVVVDPKAFQSGFLLQLPMWQMAGNVNKTFGEMSRELVADKRMGIHNPTLEMDRHFKLSIPFSCLVMALCCPPIALKLSKGGGFMGVLVSICLVFVYWNTMLLSRILGTPGPNGEAALLTPFAAAWSQNLVFAIVGLLLLKKSERG